MSEKLPLLVGADPGATCGWCILRPDKDDNRYYLWRYGQITPTLTKWVDRFLRGVLETAGDREVKLVVEGQYLNMNRMPAGMTEKAMISLILNRARWQVVSELLDIPVVTVSPLKWQKGLLGATNRVKSKQRKALAKQFVEGFFDTIFVEEHEIDAICVAVHEARLSLIPVAQKPCPNMGERFRGRR